MTLDELLVELDRRGGDLSRWPPDLAARARSAAVADPVKARALADAVLLDDAIRTALAVPEPPLGYATRIAARASDAARQARRWLDPRWILALGSGWAMATAVAGFVVADFFADPDVLSYAEVALGSLQILTGN